MEYVKANETDLDQIVMLVKDTIQEIYPKSLINVRKVKN